MGSLRDQLVAKGLASKKDARRVNQEQQQERRSGQGQRKSAAELDREKAAADAAAKGRDEAARRERRQLAEAAREALEHARRLQQLLRANLIRAGGPVPFHFRKPDGQTIGRLMVSERAAWALRCGDLAIAGIDWGDDVEVALVRAEVARRLLEIDASAVLAFANDAVGLADPSLGFAGAPEVHSLLAHRVR